MFFAFSRYKFPSGYLIIDMYTTFIYIVRIELSWNFSFGDFSDVEVYD